MSSGVPRLLGLAFAAASALCLLGGLAGLIASIATAVLAILFALQGLAVIHDLSRGTKFRGALLCGLYVALALLMPWPLVILTLVGLVEAGFSLARPQSHGRGPAPLNRRNKVMEVILLQRIAKLGQMGDKVRVKNGYARNFLLPTGKALRATEANKRRFEEQKVELEARNLERKSEALAVAEKLGGRASRSSARPAKPGISMARCRRATSPRPSPPAASNTSREQIVLRAPIKAIGLHPVPVHLHPEVECTITVNVARSPEEAERQAKGEKITVVAGGLDARSRSRRRRGAGRSQRRGRLNPRGSSSLLPALATAVQPAA